MAQGWSIDLPSELIKFYEAPPTGVNNIVVTEYATGAVGGTDVWAVGAWSFRYGYPAEVEFYADRIWFGRTRSDPQTVWSSEIGNYVNFGRSSPIVDSDPVSFTINARQVQAIYDFLPLDNLLVLTSGQEWKMTAGQDDAVTPSNIGMKAQSANSASRVPAAIIGESAVYIQRQGSKVRDFRYTFDKDGFRGNEISVWADHLVEGYSFSKIDYMVAPWPVLWLVRNDGKLIGCTYMPEQEIIGWHPHDTLGAIRDTCCLPGDDESRTYGLIERTVEGVVETYIERLAPTQVDSELDYFYLDSGITYDGRNTGPTTLTLSTATGWTEGETLTVTASASLFVGASDEGDGFKLSRTVTEDVEGVPTEVTYTVRLLITQYLTGTTVEAESIGTVPEALRSVPLTEWTFMRDTVGGAWHLEGLEVVVLADGKVHPRRTVTNGKISLQQPGGVVHLGRYYRGHIETLEVSSAGGEALRNQNKLPYKALMLVKDTRGVLAGDHLDRLYEIATRDTENYDDPTLPFSGALEVDIDSQWGKDNGHVHIVSDDPLPMEILSVTLRAAVSK